ncbi:hypothetical protein [Sphingomonas sp. NIBR02145]|uniref:hypothetical protein n=1 Tax=Sphingomonas sp. NIBR02145 TaxID=3014784 RepID=UPI0022B408A4|nr:hypothetical protein [Sphingomonas sp. NIBR02145]WHU02398.1 hypothetical protein O3305_19790 [Sphingomonas sp. NIBR02145]
MAKVRYGWVVSDQAAALPGIAFGPRWLKGGRRSGSLTVLRRHNLLFKDVVFEGRGTHALEAVLREMAGHDERFVWSGIAAGAKIEEFVPSPYGGPDEQVIRVNEVDIPSDYHAHVFIPDKTYSFDGVLTSFVTPFTGFAGTPGLAGLVRDTIEGVGEIIDRAGQIHESHLPAVKRLTGSKHVVVLLTARTLSAPPLLTRRGEESIAAIGRNLAGRLGVALAPKDKKAASPAKRTARERR